jgi:hypothetical protein
MGDRTPSIDRIAKERVMKRLRELETRARPAN